MIDDKIDEDIVAYARYEESPDGVGDVFYYHPGQEPENSTPLYVRKDSEVIAALKDEIATLKEELRRLHGIDRPFICGTAGEVGQDGLHDVVLVSPAYGSDGFAMYKKHKDLSTPEY